MITVTIRRNTLKQRGACVEGLALYDAIAALLPEADTRRDRRIRIGNWTPLHSIWPYAAGYGGFVRWLEVRNIIPRANLSDANLSRADLSRADLSGANLSDANLSRADLYGAYLSGANLSGANLSRAYLSDANLSHANLSGANLSRANLSRANLSGAYLSGANLYDADLSGAYRGPSSSIPGWRTRATGYLERDGASSEAAQ